MKISIITPSYNSEKFLESTLQSVMKELPENGEHIVQDGDSKDQTIQILKKYKNLYNLIFFSEPDKSLNEAVNKGFCRANGDILGWISSDNLYAEGALKYALQYFEENPKVDFIYGHCIVIDEYDNPLYDHWEAPFLKPLKKKINSIYPRLNHGHFLNINPGLMVADCCFFLRRRLYEKWNHFFDEQYPIVMDYEFWLRVTKDSKPHYINRVFGYFRKREGQISAGNQLNAWLEVLKINHRYGGKFYNQLHRAFIRYLFGALFRKLKKFKGILQKKFGLT